jgi:hypothetical protein
MESVAWAKAQDKAQGKAQAKKGGRSRVLRFWKEDLGKLPQGWVAAKTGQGKGSVWKVVADDTSPSKTGYVLTQTAEGPRPLFNLCVVGKSRARDVEITVDFKALKGKIDQGGGFVWRYQDAKNYYVARMNPLEDNYRFYKVVAGKRTQLATREGLKVPAGKWHKLKIEQRGNVVKCYLDGKQVLEAKDDTFQQPGKVGLWTKADAVTSFDNFAARRIRRQPKQKKPKQKKPPSSSRP